MDTKARSAIVAAVVAFSFPEKTMLDLVNSGEIKPGELYRIMDSLDFVWSSSHHVWTRLAYAPNLDAARRNLARRGLEWQQARLEWLMVKCGMLTIEESS